MKFKKFFSYLITFLVVMVISAGITVSLATSNGNISQVTLGGQTNASSLFSGILSAFENKRQFNVKGSIDVEFENSELNAYVYVNADTADSSNLKFDGFIDVNFAGENRHVKFSFYNNTIYLVYENLGIRAQLKSIEELIDFIKAQFLSDAGDLLGGENELDTDSLLQTLMDSLSNAEEKELEDGKETKIVVDGIARVKLITDKDGAPKSVEIESDDLDAAKIKANLGVNFNAGLTIKDPEITHKNLDFVDIHEVTELAKSLVGTDGLSAKANIVYGQDRYDGDLQIDFKNKNFALSALGKYAVTYYNGDIFLDVNGVKVEISQQLINDLKEKYGDVNLESLVAIEKVNEIVSKFKGINYLELLSSVKSVDANNHGLTIVVGSSMFNLDGDLKIYFGIVNNKLSSIVVGAQLNGKQLAANIDITDTCEKIEIDDEEYFELERVYYANKDFFSTNQYTLSVDFDLALISGQGTIKLDFVNDYYNVLLKASGNRKYAIDLTIDNGQAYLALNDIKLTTSVDRLKDLLNRLGVNDFDLQQIDKVKELKEKASSISVKDLLKSIKNISAGSHGIAITIDGSLIGLNGDYTFEIDLEENVVRSAIVYGEFLGLYVNVEDNAVEKTAENFAEYLDVDELIDSLKGVDYSKLSLFLDFKANVGGADYNGNVVAKTNGKRAELKFNLNGKYDLSADIQYVDEIAYVRVGNIYVSVKKSVIEKLLASLPKQEIDGEQLKAKIQKFVDEFDFDKLKLIKGVRVDSSIIELVLDKSVLATPEDTIITISIFGGSIDEINILNAGLGNGEKISLKARLVYGEPYFDELNKEQYLDYEKAYNYAIELINSQTISAKIKAGVNIDGYLMNFDVDLRKDLVKKNMLGYMLVNLTAGEDKLKLESLYDNETIFLGFNGLKLKLEREALRETAQNVCQMLGVDYSKYNDIISIIYNILGGKNLTDEIKINQGTMSSLKDKLVNSTIKIDFESVLEILNNTTINSSTIKTSVDMGLFGGNGVVELEINLEDYKISHAKITNVAIKNILLDLEIEFNDAKPEILTLTDEEKANYIDIYQLSIVAQKVLNTLKNKMVAGNFILDFDYKGEKNRVDVNYGIKLENKKLKGYIKTTFKGVNVNIFLDDGVFYLDISDLKIYVAFDEIGDVIDFINAEFKTNINLDKTIDDIENQLKDMKQIDSLEEIVHKLSTLNLDFVNKVDFTSTSLVAYFKSGLRIFVEYGETIEKVEFYTKGITVELFCTQFDNVEFKQLNKEEYQHYTILTDAYYSVKKTLAMQQFSVSAEAKSIKGGTEFNSATVGLNLDITGGISANGSINVKGDTNLGLGVNFFNDMLYVNYNNLRLSMNRESINELLAIVLEVLNIDPTTIGFLQTAAKDLDIKTDNLQTLFPEVDFGNPLNMIKLVKGLSLQDGMFTIELDGSVLNKKGKQNMFLDIKTSENGVERINLRHIYTGNGDEYFDFSLVFNKFEGVTNLTSEQISQYIDISSSPDLVRGLVNTSSLDDYHISGTVALSLGENLNVANVAVDIKIKLDENNKPFVSAEFTNYPLLGGVTRNNTNGTALNFLRKRAIYVTYKDGLCYLRTIDEHKLGVPELTRTTIIPLDYLLSNASHYVQWLFGFTDSIQNQINDAIVKAKSQPIDISSVLKSYNFDGSRHNIEINMEAITHDSSVGTLTIGLTTAEKKINEDSRLYLSKLDIDLQLLSVIHVKTNDNNILSLNVGESLDMNSKQSEIDNLAKNYKEYLDYWEEDGKNPELQNHNLVTITLDNAGGKGPTTATGYVGDTISLPTPSKVIDDGEKITTYTFDGWYYADGTAFTDEVYYENKSLVAHYKEEVSVKYYYTLTIDVDGTLTTKKILEGQTFTLTTPTKATFDDNNTRIVYTFENWHLENGDVLTNYVMPQSNLKVVARFNEDVKHYFNLTIDRANGSGAETRRLIEGSSISLDSPTKATYDDGAIRTEFTFTKYYEDGEEFTLSTMPQRDVNLTAHYDELTRKYVLVTLTTQFYSQNPIKLLEGEYIKLPDFATYNNEYESEVDGTYYKYEFKGWKKASGEYVTELTLVEDLTLTADWVVVEQYTKKLLTIYEVDAEGYSRMLHSGQQIVGKEIDLTQYLKDEYSRVFRSYSRTSGYADEFTTKVMPETSLSLYVQNRYKVTFVADEAKFSFNEEQYFYQREAIKFKDVSNWDGKQYDDKDGQHEQYNYKFLGWLEGSANFTETTMLNRDLTLTSSWDKGYKKYFKITFVLTWAIPSDRSVEGRDEGSPNDVTANGNEFYVLQGEAFDPNEYKSTCRRSFLEGLKRNTYEFNASWSTENPITKGVFTSKMDSSKFKQATRISSLQSDQTYYAYWQQGGKI